MKKQITFLLITVLAGLVLVTTAFAQNQIGVQTKSFFNSVSTPAFGTTQEFLPVSPQAGSLGIFGQIPVGNYTGTAEISIPLYEIKYKELSVPISINYHASGVKPDIFPGPVGLGWTLQAGGMISRVINGDPDFGELISNDDAMEIMTEDLRSKDDWSSTEQIERPLKGNLTMDPKTDPDEYYFNINGKTGKFYMHADSTFSVQTTDGGYLQITTDIGDLNGCFSPLEQSRLLDSIPMFDDEDHPNKITGYKYFKYGRYENNVTIRSTLRGFTAVDENGVKYTFGGSLYAVEFSRPGLNEASLDTQLFLGAFAQPMSWLLTSIESPNGYKFEFTYEQETSITKVRFCDVAVVTLNDQTRLCEGYNYPDAWKSTLINGCHLTRITFPNGHVDFTNSIASDQLDYPSRGSYDMFLGYFDHFTWYDDINWANTGKVVHYKSDPNKETVRNRFFPYKLDAIKVYSDLNKLVKNILLSYTQSRNTRLKLTDLRFGEWNDGCLYSFEYNPTPLPPYMSNKTDYYGYYNGRELFAEATEVDKGNNYYHFMLENPGYLDRVKTPNFTYAQAEVLQKIIYPTKGYTILEYEPHEYGCSTQVWPFAVKSNTNGNLASAGLRIKSIKNYDKGNILLDKKCYHYVKNYLSGGMQSSGVLAYQPQYEERYENVYLQYRNPSIVPSTFIDSYLRFSSNPIYPMMSTRGNHVTYSEVTVEESGNGYTVYKYKNYDNGYVDKVPINYTSNILSYDSYGDQKLELWKKEEGQSLKLERGQLLSKEIYLQDKLLQRKEEYIYNDSASRFDEGVRYLHFVPNSVNMINMYKSYRISAGLHYTYFPFLREKVVTDYTNKPIKSKEQYTYTSNYRLPKMINSTDSQGQEIKTEYLYPFEIASSNPIFQIMTDKNMYNYPIENALTKGDFLISKSIWEYAQGLAISAPLLVLPHKLMKQYTTDGPVYTEIVIDDYDSYANPQKVSYHSGETYFLQWSGKGANLESKTDALGHMTYYTYFPLVGLSSETDPNGLTIHYQYDSMGRLVESFFWKKHRKEILKSYIYHYANQ